MKKTVKSKGKRKEILRKKKKKDQNRPSAKSQSREK
jgi:hypothetical protein